MNVALRASQPLSFYVVCSNFMAKNQTHSLFSKSDVKDLVGTIAVVAETSWPMPEEQRVTSFCKR